MSNLSKLEFVDLDISGKSYMSWVLDAEIHLDAMDLANTIKDKNQASNQDRAKAIIFLRHHLDEGLKMEYLNIKDPVILWNNLKDRYDHLKMVVLPQARYDWTRLRLQDFKSITEQHNGLIMKNHESRPTGSCPFPKVNETNFHQAKRGRGRGPSRGHDCDRGRNSNHGNNNAPKNPPHHQQWKRKEQKHEVVQAPNAENACYRCGGKWHWSRTCRTPKHLVELYQASLKKTEENAEANFISEDNL
ncbi:PREDICTED: uncharacterized protein LOC109226019 [Nicotiana attenuata]|uniref:uncharacterized protein LOC109226019 n=1 Tax=Nicotiana attenuata TaxID=49451 RepID=UPI000904B352|nr:PREDICTED: uncharacterized protein LOC109226019 [Nicotiana attenuata]